MAHKLRADVEGKSGGSLSKIRIVLYDALPYAIGATGPKLGKKRQIRPFGHRGLSVQ